MGVTSYIRKYNQRINELLKRRKNAIKLILPESEMLATEIAKNFDHDVVIYKEVIEDLEFIRGNMPTINPIEKGNYNDAPEGLKEIPLSEWQRGLFHYRLFEPQSKQVRGEQTFDLRLFDVPNFENQKLGYAIMNDWFDKEVGLNRPTPIVRFCRYGTDEQWNIFEKRFNAQFAGDNS